MQFPITIGLHRSYLGVTGMAVAHGLAVGGIGWMPWSIWVKAGLITSLVGSVAFLWQLWNPRITGLRLLDGGGMECRLAGDNHFQAAQPMPGGTVHPWLTVLRLTVDKKRITAVILPDSITVQEFRRLRVWLRWRAESTARTDAA